MQINICVANILLLATCVVEIIATILIVNNATSSQNYAWNKYKMLK
jgi:hypothetical protein